MFLFVLVCLLVFCVLALAVSVLVVMVVMMFLLAFVFVFRVCLLCDRVVTDCSLLEWLQSHIPLLDPTLNATISENQAVVE